MCNSFVTVLTLGDWFGIIVLSFIALLLAFLALAKIGDWIKAKCSSAWRAFRK